MEIIRDSRTPESRYIGSCKCGTTAIYTRSESTENVPVVGGNGYGLIVKCPSCEDGYLYSPYLIYGPEVEDTPI